MGARERGPLWMTLQSRRQGAPPFSQQRGDKRPSNDGRRCFHSGREVGRGDSGAGPLRSRRVKTRPSRELPRVVATLGVQRLLRQATSDRCSPSGPACVPGLARVPPVNRGPFPPCALPGNDVCLSNPFAFSQVRLPNSNKGT